MVWTQVQRRLSKRQSQTTVFLRNPITQMIFFNQDIVTLVKCTYNINGTNRKRRNLGFHWQRRQFMNEFDRRIWALLISSSKKGLKISDQNGDWNPDLCDTGAVLYQLSYQAKWERVVMWVDFKPVDVEIDDVNSRIFLVTEMQTRAAEVAIKCDNQIHSFQSAFQILVLTSSFLY